MTVPKSKSDRRVLVWWAVAFGLLAALALVCWFAVKPYLEVRAAAERSAQPAARAMRRAAVDYAHAGNPQAAGVTGAARVPVQEKPSTGSKPRLCRFPVFTQRQIV